MNKFSPLFLKILCAILLLTNAVESQAECRRDTIKYYEYQNGTLNKILLSRKVSTFNALNLPTNELDQDWDSVGNKWLDDRQIIFVYDNNGNLTSETSQSWWPSLSEWVNGARETYTYNSMNLQTSYVLEYHNGSSWYNDTRISQAYDLNGNETEYKKEEWSTGSNMWENKSKSVRTWDANNRQLTSISLTWDDMGAKWVNRSKYQPSYDGNGNWILGLSEAWDNNSSKWVNDRKIVLTYDGNNNRLTRENLNWDVNSAKWVGSTKYTYTFVNNKRMSDLYENWVNNAYVKIDQYTYTYDGENVAGYVKEKWVSNAWENSIKRANTYNGNNQITEYAVQNWIANEWVNSSKNLYIYNADNDQSGIEQYYAWQSSGMYYGGFYAQYYSCTTVAGVATIEEVDEIVIYPNPTSRFLTIQSKSPIEWVEMYDLKGQQMLQSDENKLDLSRFEAGLYLVKVYTSLGTSVKRIQLTR